MELPLLPWRPSHPRAGRRSSSRPSRSRVVFVMEEPGQAAPEKAHVGGCCMRDGEMGGPVCSATHVERHAGRSRSKALRVQVRVAHFFPLCRALGMSGTSGWWTKHGTRIVSGRTVVEPTAEPGGEHEGRAACLEGSHMGKHKFRCRARVGWAHRLARDGRRCRAWQMCNKIYRWWLAGLGGGWWEWVCVLSTSTGGGARSSGRRA